MSVAVENLSIAVESLPDAGDGWPAADGAPSAGKSPRELLAKLPPSDRDFEVYAEIVAGGGTTRSAASQFGISQTRVVQVKNRVRDWLKEVDLDSDDAEPTPRELGMARCLAADRFDHLYSEAMTGWRSSQGEIGRTRVTAFGDEVQTTTKSFGDPRYLFAAARLAKQQMNVVSRGILTRGWAKAADVREASGVAIDEIPPPKLHDVPSEEACSAPVEKVPVPPPASLHVRDVSRVPERRLDPRERKQRAARDAFFAPVQTGQLGELAQSVLSGSKQAPKSAPARPGKVSAG